MRREYAKAAGWAALILLFATGVSYAVRSSADLGLWVPLGLGVAMGAFYLAEFRAEVGTLLRSRGARQGANSLVYTLAVIAIAVLVQALLVNNGASFDLTKNKSFTLADETVKAVKNLEGKVQVLAFYGPEQKAAFEDLLKRVRKVNPAKFDYEFVNINKEPLKAQQYGVRSLGTAVAVAGDKSESFNGSREEDLLNALLKVSSGAKKQVYFLQGHQERGLDDLQPGGASELKKGLESATFLARSLNLAASAKAEVPEDCAALVLAGPRSDLLAPELDALTRYLARGGRVVAALDPRVNAPGLKAWLQKAGVRMRDDIAIDLNPFNQLFGGSPVAPVIQDFDGSHPITRDLRQQQGQAMFPQTRSLELAALPEGANGTVLARTLASAFGWVGTGNAAPNKPGVGDHPGPLDLMAAVELPVKAFGGDGDKKARLVVLGSSQLFANQLVVAFNNQDLLVNSVRWLADEEKRIALAPKPVENNPLMLDRARLAMVWWSFILLALAAAGAGLGVWVLRRRQTA
jgi:ABC-type uncharacterized transport system involved in gliding motility auxiliary subunit